MYDVSCKLVSKRITQNEIGVEKAETIETEVPIIKVESIYANEYYEANQAGFQPTLRIKISALNYNNESEVIYKGITYSIDRVDTPNTDEIVLICERKIKDVKSN